MTYPRCAASLRDGTACRRTVVKAEQFCSSHLALVQEYGEERVRAGNVPRRKRASVALVPVDGAPQASLVNGDRPEDSRDIRARLADAATRGAPEIERVLLEAVGASSARVGEPGLPRLRRAAVGRDPCPRRSQPGCPRSPCF